MSRTLPPSLVPLFAVLAAGSHAAMAASIDCYPSAFRPAPMSSTHAVVIDETAPMTAAFSDMTADQLANAGAPARYLVLRIAGTELRRVFDAELQAPPTPSAVARLSVKAHRAVLACLSRQATQVRGGLEAALAQVKRDHRPKAAHSEVVFGLHETLRLLATPGQSVRLSVYSDGLEHGSGPDALSFYASRRPRHVTPSQELRKLPTALRELHSDRETLRRLQINWYGFAARGNDDAPAIGAAAIVGWRDFWTSLLSQHWGVGSVTIGSTVLR